MDIEPVTHVTQAEQFYNEAEWNQTWEPSGKVSFFLTTDQPSPRIKSKPI